MLADNSTDQNNSPAFDGFGGGDFGGGGSSDSFYTPDTSSNDSGNSYDSGSLGSSDY